MALTNEEVIFLLKIIANNLILGRSIENSIFLAMKNLQENTQNRENWIILPGSEENQKFADKSVSTRHSD